MPSRSAGQSFCMFDAGWDMAKPCSRQNLRRTAASVSEKVGRRLRYQALVETAWRACGVSCAASKVTRENRPSRQGVVRAMALYRPLALRLHPEVVAHLAERGLQLPALDKPAQDLHGILGGVGAQQGLRVEVAKGITHQHPADRNDGHPTMAPNGGGGADLDDTLAAAIPTRHRDALPWRGRVDQHLGQGRQALALGPGSSVGAGQAGRAGS